MVSFPTLAMPGIPTNAMGDRISLTSLRRIVSIMLVSLASLEKQPQTKFKLCVGGGIKLI